jgi:hypothetical protein
MSAFLTVSKYETSLRRLDSVMTRGPSLDHLPTAARHPTQRSQVALIHRRPLLEVGPHHRCCRQVYDVRDLRVSGSRARIRSTSLAAGVVAVQRLSASSHPRGFSTEERLGGILGYSISSSARASNVGGTVSPSALAVFRLITSSNSVGCSIGSCAGFAPLSTRST